MWALADVELKPLQLYEGYREGYFYLTFAEMGPAFAELDQRAELCVRVNRIAGVEISAENQFQGIGFAKLRGKGAMEKLFETLRSWRSGWCGSWRTGCWREPGGGWRRSPMARRARRSRIRRRWADRRA